MSLKAKGPRGTKARGLGASMYKASRLSGEVRGRGWRVLGCDTSRREEGVDSQGKIV